MIDRRNVFIIALSSVPLFVSLGFGVYAMWVTGFWKILFWVFPACWATAWLGAKFWRRRDEVTELAPLEIPRHFTDRDQAAGQIVRRHQEAFATIDKTHLSDPQHYLNEVQSMAKEMASVYRMATSDDDPINSLTVVELVAAIRLAVDDIEEIVNTSVPGSQMLTVGQWKGLGKAPEWIGTATNVYWAASILINPMNLLRYGTSQVTSKPVLGKLQTELMATIYMRFIRQAGFYLIEMYSGRLRGGASAYQQRFGNPAAPKQSESSVAIETTDVTIALFGQTGAGKSSLINALVPGGNAVTSVLPETQTVQRYDFAIEANDSTAGGTTAASSTAGGTKLSILDTPGYGAVASSKKEAKSIHGEIDKAIRLADVVLLVLDAHSTAKALDVEMLQRLTSQAQQDPRWRMCPIVAVLTLVDLLPPASEWSPPYQIDSPTESKEESIAAACQYAVELFGDQVAAVVPVCLRPESDSNSPDFNPPDSKQPDSKQSVSHPNEVEFWGVEENLIPALSACLDEGKMVSFLKSYEAGLDKERWKNVLRQTRSLAGAGLRIWLDERVKS